MISVLLIGAALISILFAVLWAICVKVRNYSFLDVAWSYTIAVLAPLYAIWGDGYLPRRVILATIGTAWSLRLGTHILVRVLQHHPKEDVRYESLRQDWNSPFQFLLFFELQALIGVILSLPFLLTAYNAAPSLHPIEIIGYALALLALGGEALSDHQMSTFQRDPANKGRVCRAGLWKYSRHPNYFFEALIWWGFFLAALATPWGWTTIVCPLLMLWFLLKVTGIPLTEKYSLRSRGDAYLEYQRTTSAFIPWFPKSS